MGEREQGWFSRLLCWLGLHAWRYRDIQYEFIEGFRKCDRCKRPEIQIVSINRPGRWVGTRND